MVVLEGGEIGRSCDGRRHARVVMRRNAGAFTRRRGRRGGSDGDDGGGGRVGRAVALPLEGGPGIREGRTRRDVVEVVGSVRVVVVARMSGNRSRDGGRTGRADGRGRGRRRGGGGGEGGGPGAVMRAGPDAPTGASAVAGAAAAMNDARAERYEENEQVDMAGTEVTFARGC